MRESFLRELMILQSSPILSADSTYTSFSSSAGEAKPTTTNLLTQHLSVGISSEEKQQQQQQDLENKKDNNNTENNHNKRQVNITLLDDSGSRAGRTLSGSFVGCDTNLTHILLNDLKTPIGIQSSALVRLNDVIAITYR